MILNLQINLNIILTYQREPSFWSCQDQRFILWKKKRFTQRLFLYHSADFFCLNEWCAGAQRTYLRVDELAMISITAEEMNTLLVQTVSGNDSAINIDWEVSIQDASFHRENVYSLAQLIVIRIFVDSISKSHRTKWSCGVKNK